MASESAEPGGEFQIGSEDNQDAQVEPEKTKNTVFTLFPDS